MSELVFSEHVGERRGALHHKGYPKEGILVSPETLRRFCVSFLEGRGHTVILRGEDEPTAEIPLPGRGELLAPIGDRPDELADATEAVVDDLFGRDCKDAGYEDVPELRNQLRSDVGNQTGWCDPAGEELG